MSQDKLLLIDVYALVYRAFFALPPLTTSTGKPISAAYGFQRMLDRVLREEKPSHVVAAFDAGIPAERFAAVPEYKANRAETPVDLRPQFETVRKILDGYGIPIVEVEDEEADDCIATISTQASARQLDSVVVSGDLDLLQLVNPHTTVVVTRRGISEMTRYDEVAVRERFGLSPEQLPDYRGLKGDPSDNLPGVPGIGEKTASKLIAQFGSLDALLANVDKVTPKRIADLLREHADKARACRDVSRAKRDLSIVFDWEGWRYHEPSKERLSELYQELEFRSLLAKVSTPAFAELTGGNGAITEAEPVTFDLGSYKVIDKTAAIGDVLKATAAAQRVAISTVPVLSSWRTQRPYAVALSWRAREAVVIPADALTENPTLRDEFAKLLTSDARKIVFDAKNVSGWLHAHGLQLDRLALDVMLAAGIQDPARGEPTLAAALRGTPGEGVPVPDTAAEKSSTLFEPGQTIDPVCASPADAMLRAADSLLQAVREVGVDKVLLEIEQPLAPLLARMEATGFRLDLDELARIRTSLESTIAHTSADIYRLAGEEFNLNSPKVLGTILFEKLGLPAGVKKKSGYGTGAEVLAPLAAEHEIAAKLLQYREVSKLKSTYVDALPTLIDPVTHRLHTTLHQLGAATGRLSSSDPNLQNIPVRSEVGRAIRRAFLPATEGNLLMAADYSQIELRILAHMSRDENFLEAFRRGDDIHAFTARAVFNIPENEKVSSEMRRRAKAVNFGIIYGISDFGLSQSAGMSRAEAKTFIAEYLARFPKVKGFIDSTLERARNDGFVTTLVGRRRYLPDLRSRVYPIRAAAERMAINAPAQGSAADLIKLAMVKIGQLFAESSVRANLVLQVHDELIFDVPPDEVNFVRTQVKDAMENAMQLDVPLVVDFKVGPNWAAVEVME
ncbi:MAG TPA: DNA polymerase I [Candidatus Eremiobacteraceae bacterium]|nr:DNA polymerase I [Candidatus Eremiobacteraceae bacterium]